VRVKCLAQELNERHWERGCLTRARTRTSQFGDERTNQEATTFPDATEYASKMKTKFSYCDQIKFNEPVLKPGIPNKQHIASN